jgi:hypothetical protein
LADTRGAILIVDADPGTSGLLGEYLSGRKLAVTQAHTLDGATRPLGPEARGSIGTALEQAALQAIQRGVSGEKAEVIRALNQVRTLIRFAHDLGDISAETAEQLEVPMTKARRSVGLT